MFIPKFLRRKKKTTLPKEKLAEYRDRLERERKNLLQQIQKNERPENFGDDRGDLDEEANEAEELGYQLAVNQTLRDRMNEIEAALSRIQENTHGVCENCGKEISEKMLDIVPESNLCEDCKKRK